MDHGAWKWIKCKKIATEKCKISKCQKCYRFHLANLCFNFYIWFCSPSTVSFGRSLIFLCISDTEAERKGWQSKVAKCNDRVSLSPTEDGVAKLFTRRGEGGQDGKHPHVSTPPSLCFHLGMGYLLDKGKPVRWNSCLHFYLFVCKFLFIFLPLFLPLFAIFPFFVSHISCFLCLENWSSSKLSPLSSLSCSSFVCLICKSWADVSMAPRSVYVHTPRCLCVHA